MVHRIAVGLAKPDVVGDEQVNARKEQGLAERLERIGIDADAGVKRGLEQSWVGGSHAVLAQRVEVRGELSRLIKALLPNQLPALGVEDLRAQLQIPDDIERFSLCVVIQAGQSDDGRIAMVRVDGLHLVRPSAHPDRVADARSTRLREIRWDC
jgi:hypothetical protein